MYTTYQSNEEQAANLYREAQRRVEAKLSFIRSLIVYLFVNSIVFSIWLSTQGYAVKFGDDFHIYGWSYPWYLWVAVPWGIVLTIKFLRAFILPGRYNHQEMLENEMRKMGQSYTNYPVPTQQQEQK